MGQPEFVPVTAADRVVVTERLPTPDPWLPERVGELKPGGVQPSGPRLGSQGPDQGYALRLARTIEDRIVLAPHEHLEDAVAGCTGVATRRSGLFGRAPVIYDVMLAFSAFGFFEGAPAELVAWRKPRFAGAAQHYGVQRAIVDAVPESTLRMTPDEVAASLATDWRTIVGATD